MRCKLPKPENSDLRCRSKRNRIIMGVVYERQREREKCSVSYKNVILSTFI
jgi:hypothetical protein